MKKTIIVIMMCLIPIISSSHSGKEIHCSKNHYDVPCYDESLNKVVYEQKSTEKQEVNNDESHLRHHFMEFFKEGVLVCGNIYTDNPIAREVLLDPTPDWRYGIYKKWLDNSSINDKIKELGNFYFCRYSLY